MLLGMGGAYENLTFPIVFSVVLVFLEATLVAFSNI
jgi:hypothetical protein